MLVGLLGFAAWCPVTIGAVRSGWVAAGAAVFVLGLPLAPTFTGLYLLVGAAAREGRENETFALMNAVVVIGFGVGSTATGLLTSVLRTAAAAGYGTAAVGALGATAMTVWRLRRKDDSAPPAEA